MKEDVHSALVGAYEGWQKLALAALLKAQGNTLQGITRNMIARLEEDREAGRDLLPRLREIHPRLLTEFEAPKRYGSSYRIDCRQEMAELEEEIVRLESELQEA